MALQARDASTVVSFAKFAGLIVPKRACAHSFYHVEASGITESHLWMPERAIHVDPVVICGALERLTRKEWTSFLLLSGIIFFFGVINELFLQALFLSVPFALLLMRNFRLLVEVLFSDFVGT